ncbi:MAG: choice-of-anchor D domain-containing protein [Myxococcota bacterium]|nr:choice-of-anchor D domain-containing protein [Myxococcota bacterium]
MRSRVLIAAVFMAACADDVDVIMSNVAPTFQPSSLDFQARDIGLDHTLDVLLTSNDEESETVTQVQFSESLIDFFKVRTSESQLLVGLEISAEQPLRMKVIFAPTSVDELSGTMSIVTDKNVYVLPIVGRGRNLISQFVSLTPASIDFGATALGTRVERQIKVKNTGTEVITILEVRSANTKRKLRAGQNPFWVTQTINSSEVAGLRVPPGRQVALDVEFLPRTVSQYSDTIQLVIEDQGIALLDVSGSGAVGGEITCSPSRIDFGQVPRGRTADEATTCTVKNGVFRLQSLAFDEPTSDNYSIVSYPRPDLQYAPGDNFNVNLRLTGKGLASPQRGNLQVISSHGYIHELAITGTITATPKSETALTVKLTWDTYNTDFDLHLVRGDGQPFEALNDCYFQEKNPDWGTIGVSSDDPFLDKDDQKNGGPEEINLAVGPSPKYRVYVHYYGGASTPSTIASVAVEFFGTEVLNESRLFTRCGEMWEVAQVSELSGVPRIQSTNNISFNAASGDCP